MSNTVSGAKIPKESGVILGIDPGTRITGYGLISTKNSGYTLLDYGCIRPPSTSKLSERYLVIYEAVEELIRQYQPSALVVETQYVGRNVQSALTLGGAKGIVIVAAKKYKIPVFAYAPTAAKKAIGNGKASKVQVQAMLKHILKLSVAPSPEDAADALALAICHAHMRIKCEI
jgi:crossover junction endodeoxyribonuclease RuvC